MSLLKEELKNILNKHVENTFTECVAAYCNANFSTNKGFGSFEKSTSETTSSYTGLERWVDFSLPNLIRFFALCSQNDRKSLLNLSTPQLLNLSYKHRLEGLACSP